MIESNINLEIFDTRKKTFHFRLDGESCYECCHEKCSLYKLSLDDIKNYDVKIFITNESAKEYCIGMAQAFLEGGFKEPLKIFKHKCDHYSLLDGQHRICVAAHLKNKGANIEIKAIIEQEHDQDCYYCGFKKCNNGDVSSIGPHILREL